MAEMHGKCTLSVQKTDEGRGEHVTRRYWRILEHSGNDRRVGIGHKTTADPLGSEGPCIRVPAQRYHPKMRIPCQSSCSLMLGAEIQDARGEPRATMSGQRRERRNWDEGVGAGVL